MKVIVAASGLLALLAACHSEENLGFTSVGQPRWAIALGHSGSDVVTDLAFDSNGDVVVVGDLWIPPAIAGPQVAGRRPFITWLSGSDGTRITTHQLISADVESHAYISALAIGPDSSAIVVGHCGGTISFGFGARYVSPADSSRPFVAAYAASGELLWLRTLNDSAYPRSVAVDGNGRIFVTGWFSASSLDINGQVFSEVENDPDMFVVAYDPQGTLLWGTALQGSKGEAKFAGPHGHDIAIAANGDVLVTGGFAAPMSFGGAVIEPESEARMFLLRFRNDGQYLASQALGPVHPMISASPDITVDATGHIIIQHPERHHSLAYDKPAVTTLRMLDDSGVEMWSSQLPMGGTGAVRALTSTRGGLVLSSSWADDVFNGNDFVPGSVEVLAFDDVGAAGRALFGARLIGPSAAAAVDATAVSATGAIAFTGSFSASLAFGTTPLSAHGDGTDIFVVVADPPAP